MPKIRKSKSKAKTTMLHGVQEVIPDSGIALLHSIVSSPAKGDRPKVGEASPNLGMAPLFPTARDVASAEKARTKALELLEAENICVIDREWLKSQLVTIAQNYWAEYERDTRLTSSDMKNEVALLQRDLGKVISRLHELSPATSHALNAGVRFLMPKQIGPVQIMLRTFTEKESCCTTRACRCPRNKTLGCAAHTAFSDVVPICGL